MYLIPCLVHASSLNVLVEEPGGAHPILPAPGHQVLGAVVVAEVAEHPELPDVGADGPDPANPERHEVEEEAVPRAPVHRPLRPRAPNLEKIK